MVVPRALRMNFLVRLIMPWRLPAWAVRTVPVAVTLKRFLALDLVFILGISVSSSFERYQARLGMPLWPVARSDGAVYWAQSCLTRVKFQALVQFKTIATTRATARGIS